MSRALDWGGDGTPSERVRTALFGDRYGLVVFLTSLLVLTALTRIGIFITDTYTVANAFAAVTDGHLAVRETVYGSNLDTPGMIRVDGEYYGRNYGQIVASIPAYLLVQALSVVADLRIALAGGWSLLVLALGTQLGHLRGRPWAFTVGGSVGGLTLFVLNVSVASPLDPALSHVIALQATTLVAGAFLIVLVYRLVTLLRTRRLGILSALIVLVGTPVAFWAPIPKRHVLTTTLAVAAIYALACSRSEAVDGGIRRRHHALAYVAVGLTAWVHAPEAIVLGTALVLADLPTVHSLSRRRLGTVAAAGLVALLPVFVTNFLITGDPVLAPRLVDRVGIPAGPLARFGSATATGGSPAMAQTPLADLLSGIGLYVGQLLAGLVTAVTEPDRLYHTFVRSGFVDESAPGGGRAINLAVLEAAPVIVGAAVAPAVALRSLWHERAESQWDRLTSPPGATALVLAVLSVLMMLLYIQRLPLYAQVTVRYLLVLFVVGVLALVLATPAGRALRTETRAFAWALAATVLVGSQLLLVVLVGLDPATGEAFQFHALLGLAVATPLALWTVVATRTYRLDRAGAAILGVATATGFVLTCFLVLAYDRQLGVYPVDGDHALPLVRWLADLLLLL